MSTTVEMLSESDYRASCEALNEEFRKLVIRMQNGENVYKLMALINMELRDLVMQYYGRTQHVKETEILQKEVEESNKLFEAERDAKNAYAKIRSTEEQLRKVREGASDVSESVAVEECRQAKEAAKISSERLRNLKTLHKRNQ